MKSAANQQKWESPTFIAHGLKWYMEIYPNGCDRDLNDAGWVQFFVHLAYLPLGLNGIATKLRLIIIDPVTDHICDSSVIDIFNAGNMSYGWFERSLSFEDMQKFDKLYFVTDIELCGVTNADGNEDITHKYIDMKRLQQQAKLQLNSFSSFTWKITDLLMLKAIKATTECQYWKSDVFTADGFKWYLDVSVYPNRYINLFLNLALIPPKIKQITARYKMTLNETQTTYRNNCVFNEDHMHYGWDAYDQRLSIANIQDCDELTFGVKIEINGVIDENDDDVTDKYINNNINKV